MIKSIVENFAILTSAQSELSLLEAKVKALKKTVEATTEYLTDTIRDTGPVVVNGQLLAVESERKVKQTKIGDQELVAGVKAYDPAAGEIVAHIASELKETKRLKNEKEATTEYVLIVQPATSADTAPRVSVSSTGQAQLVA